MPKYSHILHIMSRSTISLSARLLLGTSAIILPFVLARSSIRATTLSLFTLTPTLVFFRLSRAKRQKSPVDRADFELMLWTYFTMASVGFCLSSLLQLAALMGSVHFLLDAETKHQFMTEFFRTSLEGLDTEQLKIRASISNTWQNWCINFILFFFIAGFGEETLKFMPIIYARKKYKGTSTYIDLAAAGALGYGTMESILFVRLACTTGESGWFEPSLTMLERVVSGSTGHALLSILTALRAIRRDSCGEPTNTWRLLSPSACLHGAFNFFAVSLSTLDGNVGFIRPKGVWKHMAMYCMLAATYAGMLAWMRREWKYIQSHSIQSKM